MKSIDEEISRVAKCWGMLFLLLVGCEAQIKSQPLTDSSADATVQSDDQAAEKSAVEESAIESVQAEVATNVDGAPQAKLDIASGKLILREQPLPNPPWWGKYSQLLRDRCGIEIEVIKHETADFSDADLEYNAEMKSEIESQFGEGILGKLQEEAVSGK